MINAAIVGLGWWGRKIVGSLKPSEKLRITRAVDANPGAAGAFAAEHGLPLAHSLDEVLPDAGIDAVILATPHSLHEAQIVAAAGAGKHVFCEKPLTLTRSGAARAIAACEQAGVALGVGHERRFEPAMVEIKRLIDSGALGTIMHAESNFSHDKLANVPAGDWRASAVDAPAAGMTGMGIHLTDAYINMLGSVIEVFAQTARRILPAENGDVVSVQLRFASGATGYFSAILATPLYLRYQVFGSDAWVEARDTAHPDSEGETHLTIHRKGGEPESRTFRSIDTVRANIEAFADAAARRSPYPIPTAQKLHNIATLEAICKSAESGMPVTVD
jgi:predicted dehydrogenase